MPGKLNLLQEDVFGSSARGHLKLSLLLNKTGRMGQSEVLIYKISLIAFSATWASTASQTSSISLAKK
jgi:hypothetical protein